LNHGQEADGVKGGSAAEKSTQLPGANKQSLQDKSDRGDSV